MAFWVILNLLQQFSHGVAGPSAQVEAKVSLPPAVTGTAFPLSPAGVFQAAVTFPSPAPEPGE